MSQKPSVNTVDLEQGRFYALARRCGVRPPFMSRVDQRHPAQLPLTLRRRGAVPLQRQLADQLRQLVLHEILAAGARVPSTRALAEQLEVSRNTVAIAYERLTAEGLLEVIPARGTCVSRRLPAGFAPSPLGANGAIGAIGAARAASARPVLAAPVRALELRAPVVARAMPLDDFRLGQVDAELFPARHWRRSIARQLEAPAAAPARYGDPAGLEALRIAVSSHLRRARGIRCSPERVVIVAGCQEGLNLIARLLIEPASPVVVENPCYEGAASVFQSHGARLVPVPVDEDGLEAEALPSAGTRLAYVTPSHQFPLGFTLSLERRLALLDWAARTGAYVIEDDYDSDFRYEGSPLLALQALDAHGSVIYLGTFSKSIGAGLRLGYAVFPESLRDAAIAAKSIMNNGHATLDQAVVAEFLASGAFDQHLRRLRHQYRLRRDTLLGEIARRFGACRVDGVEGGMHVAWHLPDHAPPALPLSQRALARGVGVYPLSEAPVHVAGDERAFERVLLLGYPCLTPERIRRAVATLAACSTAG